MVLTHFTGCEQQTGLDIVGLKEGKIRKNGFRCLPGSEIGEHVLDGNAFAADDRLTPEDFLVRGDAGEKRSNAIVGHG